MRTSDPDIYAAGDAVQVKNCVTGKDSLVPLAGPANKQGRIAADNIAGIASVYKGAQGSSVMKLFELTAASTGLSERAAREAGYAAESALLFSPDHATYYPGAKNMTLKVVFDRADGRILGAQAVGFGGTEKRIDVLATAIRAGFTAEELTELDLCYAPPYSSAKDPVNMAGYVIGNILRGTVRQHTWKDVEKLADDENALFLDVLLEEENAMDWSIAHLAAQSTPVIFMTSFPEAAYNISETNCCYYLVKSHIDEVSLTRALQAALRKAAGHDANMTVIRQGSLNRVVNYADVLYIETFNNNLTLHLTDGGRVSVYSSLKDFAERLPPNFLRCHKSYMVNMNHVSSFTPHLFTLRSGGTVPIPPKKYKQIVAQYRAYLENLR